MAKAHVGIEELETLQQELIKVSKALADLRQLLDSRMEITHTDFRDGMFDDFAEAFQPSVEMVQELSDKYEGWAKDWVQKRIDHLKEQPVIESRL